MKFLLPSFFFLALAGAVSANADLKKLKAAVESEFTADWPMNDYFLEGFLKMKDGNVDAAIEMVKTMVNWRKDNDIDNIPTKEFADFPADYPIYVDGSDATGRPIFEVPNFGKWPITKAVTNGRMDKLKDYITKHIEISHVRLRKLWESKKKIGQWTLLGCLHGFDPKKTACEECLPLYEHFVKIVQNYYPLSLGNICLVNTPKAYDVVFNFVKPHVHKSTTAVAHIYDADTKKWKPYVSKTFGGDIGEEFGGKKKRPKFAHS